MQPTPVVAIVGRPNVGKSTLFNRLLGRRQAIVHNQPGVTRDRITGKTEIDDRPLMLIDTGGLVPSGDELGMNEQVRLAIDESDFLILVVDGKEGLLVADEHIWDTLRPLGKKTLLVVNKGDTRAAQEGAAEFSRMGIGDSYLLSAEHGTGMGELYEAIAAELPSAEPEEELEALRLSLVGRPNVGKSSLLNRLLGENRAVVSPIPGTTRDPTDTILETDERRYLLVDTAGIRRRAKVSGAPEELAVMMARRQIEQAELAVLVVDASEGITSGDLAIASSIKELGRGAMVAVNKWDLIDEDKRADLENSWERLDRLLERPHRVNVSALTGRGVQRILPAAEALRERFYLELPTAEVNRLFERAAQRHNSPIIHGQQWKLYYATQVGTGPPTFMLFSNRRLERESTFRRYLENRVHDELDLRGVPARLVIRRR